ncbi:MAG: NAD(P)H-quinone oxidoreductase subunit 3 [Campylobacterales bacterium]
MTHIETAHPYFGVFVFFVLTFGAFFATLLLTRFISGKLARKDTEKLKLAMYECGPEPTKQPNKVSVQWYMLALLFIIFDVEIIFMFPWAVDFKILGWFGFAAMFIFLLLLTIGFVYEWKKGALEWRSIK